MPDPDRQNPRMPGSEKNPAHTWARYSEIAFLLPSAVVVGLLLGALADRWFHITWGTAAGLILGAIGGIIQLVRLFIRMSSEE